MPDIVKLSQGNSATSEVLLNSITDPQVLLPTIVPTAMKQKIESLIRNEHVEGATLDEIAGTYKVSFYWIKFS